MSPSCCARLGLLYVHIFPCTHLLLDCIITALSLSTNFKALLSYDTICSSSWTVCLFLMLQTASKRALASPFDR